MQLCRKCMLCYIGLHGSFLIHMYYFSTWGKCERMDCIVYSLDWQNLKTRDCVSKKEEENNEYLVSLCGSQTPPLNKRKRLKQSSFRWLETQLNCIAGSYWFLQEAPLKVVYRWYDAFFSTDYGTTGKICRVI